MTKSTADELSKLHELHKSGAISDEEFQSLKEKIIKGEGDQSIYTIPSAKTADGDLPVLRKLPGGSLERKVPYTVEGNIADLIKSVLGGDNIVGLIPVESKKLNIRLAGRSFTPGIFENLLLAIIAVPFIALVFGLFAFYIGVRLQETNNMLMPMLRLLAAFILVSALIFSLIKWIYVNKIKSYPETIIAATKENLHLFLIKRNKNQHYFINRHYSLEIPFRDLGRMFYGYIDKKTKKLGKLFMIRKNTEVLLRGKLKISNDRFVNHHIQESYLFPIAELKRICLKET